jgi:hypothetical protein
MRQGETGAAAGRLPLAAQQYLLDGCPFRGKRLAPIAFLGFNLNKMG